MFNLRIIYFNCCGLSLAKFSIIEKYLSEYDLVFLSETWFIDFKSIQEKNSFLVHSPRPHQQKVTGHENGGILAICSDRIRGLVTDIKVSEFSISLKIMNKFFTAVYFPPRLTGSQIQEALRVIPETCQAIFGDFNFRLSASSERSQMITEFMAQKSLFMSLPKKGRSTVDHLFCTEEIEWEYDRAENLMSDHGRMLLKIGLDNDLVMHHNLEKISKYAFSELENHPPLAVCFNSYWSNCYLPLIECSLSSAERFFRDPVVVSEARTIVSELYGIFFGQIEDLCKIFLPVYVHQDRPLPKLSNQYPKSAIRIFKKSRRKNILLKSSNPLKTPLEESIELYTKLFESQSDISEVEKNWNFTSPITEQLSHVSPNEIAKEIQKYPKSRSGGPDGLDMRVIRILSLSQSFLHVVSRLFNLFLSLSITPEQWNISNIHLLAKDSADPVVAKTRPISLTQLFRRIFEKVTLKKWVLSSPECFKFSNFQHGFVRGFSTLSQLLCVDDAIRKPDMVGCFLDFKSAYDTVSIPILLQKLEKRGMNLSNLRLTLSLMGISMRSLITCNRVLSNVSIKREKGLFQGSILSPILFNCFIDDLIEDVEKIVPRSIYLFADDVALVAKEGKIKLLVAQTNNWADRNGMILNIPKCGVLHQNLELLVRNSRIPSVSVYKYLGLPMKRFGVDWIGHLKILNVKQQKFLDEIMTQSRFWNLKVRLVIYKVFLRSISEYCLSVASVFLENQSESIRNEIWNERENLHKKCLNWISGSRKYTRVSGYIFGIGSMHLRLNYLSARTAYLLNNMSRENHIFKLEANRNAFSILMDRRNIIWNLFNHKMYQVFKRNQSEEMKAGKKYSWIRFHKWLLEKELDTIESKLKIYFRSTSKNYKGMDQIVNIVDPRISRMAFKWRVNKFCFGKICPEGHQLSRRCYLECGLIKEEFQIYMDRKYEKEKEKIFSEYPGSTFSLLDHLLNTQQYSRFYEILAGGIPQH